MQEYLAAVYVSKLPIEKQSSMIKTMFWDDQFSFMWMMYVGIVGVKSSIFASFISSYLSSFDESLNTNTNKRKCLQFFQCYREAKSNAEMPKAISSIFTNGEIILSSTTLLPHDISSLVFFMSTSNKEQWKILNLNNCNLRDIGMNSLLELVIKNDENMSTLQYVDLSENNSSPWNVYCAIIRHCRINNLTLCGDEGMIKYVKEITETLQKNTTLNSLTLCKIGKHGVLSVENVLVDNKTTLKEINLSWGSNAKGNRLFKHTLHNDNKVMNVNILSDVHYKCSSETIDFSTMNIDDDRVYLITFGWCDDATLEKLDLSHNKISADGMDRLSKSVEHFTSLKHVNLSGNRLSPWGVYCTIIRYCCVKSLTFYGDEEMITYAEEIANSLQTNTILQSLTLCKIGRVGMQSIENILAGITSLQELNLSWDNNTEGKKILNRKIQHSSCNVNILYDGDTIGLPESINLSKNEINE